jgi:hypothetical protein
MTSTHTMEARSRRPVTSGQLLSRAPAVALAWSLCTGTLGVLWTITDLAYPWGEGRVGLMTALDHSAAGWLLVGLSSLALVALAASARRRTTGSHARRWPDRLLLGIGLLVTVLIADAGGLALLGYLPMLLGSLVLGSLPDLQLSNLWSSFVSLSHTLGGVALVLTGIVARRSARQACVRCGLVPGRRKAQGVGAAQQWALPAVVVAVVVPLTYAATRTAWFVGVPLGIDPTTLDDLGDARWAGLGLAAGAVVGAVLTTGLVSGWGEVFPRWVPGLRGRPVPVGLAVVPAVVVAAAVTSAGLSFLLVLVSQAFGSLPATTADWGAWLPTTLWPLWGVALFTAAQAYRLRRRPPCPLCASGVGAAVKGRTEGTGR